MNMELKALGKKLRAMESAEAADWLMQTYAAESPEWWVAIRLIPERSWKRPDQLRLARHYLRKMPFASPKPYEVFAEIMSFGRLVEVLRECLPADTSKMDLLIYHLAPVLDTASKTELDRKLAEDFVGELSRP